MSDLNESFEAGEAEARERGCTIIIADNRTLLVDIDSKEDLILFHSGLDLLIRHSDNGAPKITGVWSWPSSSGLPHTHLEVTVEEDLTVEQQLILQLFLYSDRTREMLTWLRLQQGIANPIRLFQPANAVRTQVWPKPIPDMDPDEMPF